MIIFLHLFFNFWISSPPKRSSISRCFAGFNSVCCSCCACRSIRSDAISFNRVIVTVVSFTRLTVLPFGDNRRDISKVPSSSGVTSSFSSASTIAGWSTENTSSTSPSFVSSRNSSFGNLPPRQIPRDPMIIDLPAPVSPVRIFSCS